MQARTRAKNSGRIRILAALAFALAICVGLIGSGNGASAGMPTGVPTADQAGKIEPSVLRDTANGNSASVMVLLADQADVSSANAMKDQDARGWYVYSTLTKHAERTQGALRASLSAQGIKYRSFWIVNALEVTVDRALLETLAARSDVGKIESNRPSRWIEDPEIANFQPSSSSPNAIELGVQNVNAPQVWAMGYTGQGIVVSNQDTGVRWTHNTLRSKYRGWNGASADHNYNWWDAIHSGGGVCGPNTQQPCDDNGHGTHTVGTSVGDDGAGNQIGVAPGATWIGCRNMDQGNGTPATYTECFQFFIAPTDLNGGNPNPALRPHVMNNSWGCPPSEGCAANSLEGIVNNTQAAGIFVEVSAGNAGPNCSTVNDPPAIYAASFSTGAYSASNNTLASFSSRGPVTIDGSNRRKPDIAAPGVGVRSALRASDTSYGSLSGTSMAGPHVVGVVALLWSARPQLVRDIATTKMVLEQSANPNVIVNTGSQTCGGITLPTIPNNHYGYGRVDALAAVNSVAQGTPTPTVTGTPPTATRTATAPTATRTATAPTATATACTAGAVLTGSLDASDPDFTRPNTFQQGGTCTTNGVHNYDVYTLQTIGGQVTASTCGGASWDTYLIIYQAPGGVPVPGFTPSGCTMAIAANDDECGLQSTVTANLVAGTYYVVVSEFSTPGGAYTVNVTAPGTCVTSTPAATGTATGVTTSTATAVASSTRTNTAVASSTATTQPATATATRTPIPTSTPCTIMFSDVPVNHTFYPFIRCLACRGIISGYADGTFKPGNEITRGQIAKMVSNAAGFSEDPGLQIYEDVNASNTFYVWINRLSRRGHMGGYACGTVPEEPCVLPQNRPYFRPYSNATRGQLAKIVSNAAGIQTTPSGVFYTDVQEDNPFYVWIMRLTERGVMSGYECGGVGEPCDPQNRPYFRPFNNVTRGQASKIVANTFYPGCEISR